MPEECRQAGDLRPLPRPFCDLDRHLPLFRDRRLLNVRGGRDRLNVVEEPPKAAEAEGRCFTLLERIELSLRAC